MFLGRRPDLMVDPATLTALPLFASLAPAAVGILCAHAQERRYAAGEVLYTTGASRRGLLVIVEGRVRIVRGRDGRQHVVHEEGRGGALGEVPVFSGGTYPATAIAAEPTRCVLLSTEALRAAVRGDPELAFVFLARLAQRTRHLVDRVDGLAAQDVAGRLARLLLQHRGPAGDGREITLGRSQHEVAEELGTVREVVVRALRQLRRQGMIEALGRGRYRVLDPRALARLAD